MLGYWLLDNDRVGEFRQKIHYRQTAVLNLTCLIIVIETFW